MYMFLDMGVVHISLTAILKVSVLAVILQANHPERERVIALYSRINTLSMCT